MKIAELRKLTAEEKRAKIKELQMEYLVARCNHATRQLKDTSSLPRLRRTIARLKMLLCEEGV
ncbi:MAG: 50S ribosomal protein L29 [Desulfovibrionaceae bacterium]|nr:50S ribosomal protein L29 [Desulfovibrionaceae bacterium]